MGSGLPQRWQLRSPGGLATPHAGLVQRLGGPSGSAGPASDWSMKPQSMHAMAPSFNTEPHEGHLFDEGVPVSTDICAVTPGVGAAARAPLTAGISAVLSFGMLAVDAAAPAAGTVNGLLHEGHFTVLPTALSGTCIDFEQLGQRMICGMGS